MEKSFTTYCVLLAVVFAVVAASIIANGEFTFLRCAGSGVCVFAALAYVLVAIICARNMPTPTAT